MLSLLIPFEIAEVFTELGLSREESGKQLEE
jgi:hypothetical protein